jgi:tetratricopeptide (TPR) repeat protein
MTKLIFSTIIFLIFTSLVFSQNQDASLQEAERLNAEAANLYKKGQFDEVMNIQLRELALREKISGAEDKKVGGIHYNLAVLYREKSRFVEALAHFEKALTIYRRHLGENDAKVFELIKTVAQVLMLKNDKKQALVTLTTALKIGKKIYGAESQQLAELNMSLGNVNASLRNFDEADKHYIRAIEINDDISAANKVIENGFRQDVGSYICFLSKAYEPGKAIKKTKELEIARRDKAEANQMTVQTGMLNYLITDLAPARFSYNGQKRNANGLVAAFVTIDKTGKLRISNNNVCGSNLFMDSALDILQNSKFKPATFNNNPILVRGFIILDFWTR